MEEGTGEGEEEEGVRRKEREQGGECNSEGIEKKLGGWGFLLHWRCMMDMQA